LREEEAMDMRMGVTDGEEERMEGDV